MSNGDYGVNNHHRYRFVIPETVCYEGISYENVDFFVTSAKDEFFKKVKFWFEINKEIRLVNLRSNV